MVSSRAVGAGAFILLGVVLFTAALFMIGSRRMLFEDRSTLYSEFGRLGQLESGAIVRVAGLDAGEVTEIQIPASPSGKFRVRMEVRDDLRHLIRTDSVATTQTEGLVGAVFVNIAPGTDQAPIVPDEGTIPGRDPFLMADLMQQASDTVAMVNETVESLRGDITKAVQQVALTAEDVHAMLEDVRPDISNIARNGSRISADTQQIIQKIRAGEGTIGKLLNDDTLYRRATEIAAEAKTVMENARSVMENVRDVSNDARGAIADFRSKDGAAQGLMSDMRVTLSQSREAMGDLADNMEALKHNFLLRGFFNRRGYFDLDAISPADYRKGVLENGKRKAMRIWLADDVLFTQEANGTEVLSEDGRTRIDSAMATYLEYLPANPIVIEGYATAGTTPDRFRLARQRAAIVRAYVLGRYELPPQNVGYMALGRDASGSPAGNDRWDGVALTLFLDRTALEFVQQGTFATTPAPAVTPAAAAAAR
jgi:phospholipid/cholesterol/gamma-HCH transport system substrate-binding protein